MVSGGRPWISAGASSAVSGSGGGPVTVQVYFQISGSASPDTVEQLREYGYDIEEKIVRVIENLQEDKVRKDYR